MGWEGAGLEPQQWRTGWGVGSQPVSSAPSLSPPHPQPPTTIHQGPTPSPRALVLGHRAGAAEQGPGN